MHVVLVGAGGLGGPLALALAAAGAELTIYDDDVVDASNLHRQVQFTLGDLGQPKAEVLAQAVRRRGGAAKARLQRWTAELARGASAPKGGDVDGDVSVIVDGSDDPLTKFAVADWAAQRRIPSVVAGALGLGGNVFVSAPGAACFRCLFENPPQEAASCAQAGVLGPVVAAVAAVAARAALGLAAGDFSDAGSIWVIDAWQAPRRVPVLPRPGCPGCSDSSTRPLQTPAVVA